MSDGQTNIAEQQRLDAIKSMQCEAAHLLELIDQCPAENVIDRVSLQSRRTGLLLEIDKARNDTEH